MSTPTETLECPFCGSHDIRFDEHGQAFVERGDSIVRNSRTIWSTCCYDCGATFANRYSKQALIDCWKRRPKKP